MDNKFDELKEWIKNNPEKSLTHEQLNELVLVYSEDTNLMVEGMIEYFACAGQCMRGALEVIGKSEEEAIACCRNIEKAERINLA